MLVRVCRRALGHRRVVDALAKAVEAQRLQLVRVQAVVLSNINILRDSSGLEVNGADVCYCCDAMALAHIVSAARHQLFRAQAVMRALALVLKTDTKDSYEATRRVVFVALCELMEETITKLEPMNLGLPTPGLE